MGDDIIADKQPAGAAEGRPRPRDLLRMRNFLAYIMARGLSTLATQMLTVAVGWKVYELTGNPLDLGLVGLAQFAPAFALIPLTGLAADRLERRKVVAVCHAAQALSGGFFLACALNGAGVWPYFLALVLYGGARAFQLPANQAFLPNLVGERLFANAVAYDSSVRKTGQLAGPMLGGILIAWVGDWVFLGVLVLFTLASAAILVTEAKRIVRQREPFGLQTVLGGFSFVWREKVILGAISLDLFAVLFGGVIGLMPVYAKDILHVGPEGLGLMRTMPGVGALISALVLTQMSSPRHTGRILFVSLTVFAASVIVFGLSTQFWLSLVALGVYGASDMLSVYIRTTLVQIATPDAMRGRVSAVNSVFINASNELGDFRGGTMAAAVGVVPAVVAGGVITLAVTGLWWHLFPGIRRIDRMTPRL